jgi:hypothetical protein
MQWDKTPGKKEKTSKKEKKRKGIKTKTPRLFVEAFCNKYGSYLLSRIVVQYHRPWRA